MDDVSVRVEAPARGQDRVQVADRVGKVDLVEEVEEFGAEFEVLRLADAESFDDRKVGILLPGPAQDVTTNGADVRSDCAGESRAARTGDRLIGLHNRTSEGEWVEEGSAGRGAGRGLARRARSEVWPRQRGAPAGQSVKRACARVHNVNRQPGHYRHDSPDLPAVEEKFPGSRVLNKTWRRQFPETAQNKTMRAIEIRNAAIGAVVELIADDGARFAHRPGIDQPGRPRAASLARGAVD